MTSSSTGRAPPCASSWPDSRPHATSDTAPSNPELAALAAGDQLADGSLAGGSLAGGSLAEAERLLGLASEGSASVPADRRGRFEVMLALTALSVAAARGDLPVVVEQAQRLLAPARAADAAPR